MLKFAEASYKMDKKDGTWKVWDESGNLIYQMFYKNGEKTGTWTQYDSQGNEVASKTF
jgi:antitoxin component YwqK of YwqJK toxin-antitoxin module